MRAPPSGPGPQTAGVTIMRSRRRQTTVSIQVTERGIVVRAPLHTPESQIRAILTARRAWLDKTWQAVQQRRSIRSQPWFERPLFLRGQRLAVRYRCQPDARRWTVTAAGGVVWVAGPAPDARDEAAYRAVVRWLRRQARADLEARVAHWSARTGLVPSSIRVRDQRTRWGSCSTQGNLNFNWRLVMAPPAAADYVVVHELCHLREMNHSPRFWRLVESVLPDYRLQRKWLAEHGPQLRLF
ncbi:MAG: M48 family metallopeptidase [Alicyclobacillaceae bacterium]|nr:M48 family metallopeptidase [Alicyclobacillaceae bacterium]